MDRSRTLPLVLFLATVALALLLVARKDRLAEAFSFSGQVPLEQLSKAIRGPDGTFAAIFNSNKRIARINQNGELIYVIPARNNAEKGFFFANELALAPDGTLFVATTYLNTETVTVNREGVARFTPDGRFGGMLQLFIYDADAYIDNIGLIRSLAWTPEGVRFCLLEPEGVRSFLIDPLSGAQRESELTPFPRGDERVIYAAVRADGGRVAFSTAATEIYEAVPGEMPVKVYDGRDAPDDVMSIPGDLHYGGETIYFSDLGQDAIMRLGPDGVAEPVFNRVIAAGLSYQDAFFECKSFDIADGHLVLANNGKIVHMRTGERPSIGLSQHALVNPGVWLSRALTWLLSGALAMCLLALLRMVVRNTSPQGRRMARQFGLVIVMIGTAVGITAYMIFTNMDKRLDDESARAMRGYLDIGTLVINVDGVDRIRHVRDYMNDDYRTLLEELRKTITRDDEIEAGTYSGVYKVIDGKVVAVAYHDGVRGIFYPYDYQYEQSVFAQVAQSGDPFVGEVVDIYGVWLNGVAPLLNTRGELVGFLEIGVDRSAHREANRALFFRTLVDLAMVLFVLLFVFFEMGFFSSNVLDHIGRPGRDQLKRHDEGSIRFVSYIAITGVFLSASFLPLYSKSLAVPLGSLPFTLLVALPMVVETLCGAVIALLYGHLRFRWSLRTDITLACLVVALGMILTSQAYSFGWLIAGRVIVGMGMGLLMIAFRTFFLILKDEDRKQSGVIALTAGVVAGINTGSVAGGMLAARIGMANVFLVQAALLLLAMVTARVLVRKRYRPKLVTTGEAALSPWRFLGNRSVWGFFIFGFLPVTVCGFFLLFLFPLFAEEKGISTNEISLAFMIFGIGSVYLGPSLTRLTTFLFGARRAIVAGVVVMVTALLLFAHFQTLSIAYVTVALFGLTDSFIFNQGMNYLSSLRVVRRLGEDKAMGVYNVFESAGEALGPVVFGLAISLGMGGGVAVIAGTLGVSSLIFLLVTRRVEIADS